VHEILLCAEIALGRLNRRVAKQQLDTLKLAAAGVAQLRARAPEIVKGNTCGFMSCQTIFSPRRSPMARPARFTDRPSVDRSFHPGRYRRRADPAVFAD